MHALGVKDQHSSFPKWVRVLRDCGNEGASWLYYMHTYTFMLVYVRMETQPLVRNTYVRACVDMPSMVTSSTHASMQQQRLSSLIFQAWHAALSCDLHTARMLKYMHLLEPRACHPEKE